MPPAFEKSHGNERQRCEQERPYKADLKCPREVFDLIRVEYSKRKQPLKRALQSNGFFGVSFNDVANRPKVEQLHEKYLDE